MIFTVTNSNLIYSFSFTPEKVHIQINDTSNNLFMTCLEMPVEVLQIIEQQRQQFNTFHMSQVPLTENQLGSQQMSSEVAAESGHDLPDIFDPLLKIEEKLCSFGLVPKDNRTVFEFGARRHVQVCRAQACSGLRVRCA